MVENQREKNPRTPHREPKLTPAIIVIISHRAPFSARPEHASHMRPVGWVMDHGVCLPAKQQGHTCHVTLVSRFSTRHKTCKLRSPKLRGIVDLTTSRMIPNWTDCPLRVAVYSHHRKRKRRRSVRWYSLSLSLLCVLFSCQ